MKQNRKTVRIEYEVVDPATGVILPEVLRFVPSSSAELDRLLFSSGAQVAELVRAYVAVVAPRMAFFSLGKAAVEHDGGTILSEQIYFGG